MTDEQIIQILEHVSTHATWPDGLNFNTQMSLVKYVKPAFNRPGFLVMSDLGVQFKIEYYIAHPEFFTKPAATTKNLVVKIVDLRQRTANLVTRCGGEEAAISTAKDCAIAYGQMWAVVNSDGVGTSFQAVISGGKVIFAESPIRVTVRG